MPHRLAESAVLLVHLAWILFTVFGLAMAWRWPRLRYVHLAALAWAVVIQATGWECPLTSLEFELARSRGTDAASRGFVARGLEWLVYWRAPPGALFALTLALVGANAVGHFALWRRVRGRTAFRVPGHGPRSLVL